MAQVITVGVVDDDRMLLQGMASWFAGVSELRLVGTAPTVPRLVSSVVPAPDVVLLDLRLRDGSDPFANVRQLRAAGSRVLVISTVPDRRQVVDVVRAGADGYLTKDHDLVTLVRAVREIAAGSTAHSCELAFAWACDTDPDRPALSAQERTVLLAYASGMTLKAVARRTGVSAHTAKEYLDRVKDKYRRAGRPAHTKTELADRAREDGLLPAAPAG